MTDLNKQECDALKATAEALVRIRLLASKPVGDEARLAILALADAFHNIPTYAAMSAAQRGANGRLLDASIERAQLANKQFGLVSEHLAPL